MQELTGLARLASGAIPYPFSHVRELLNPFPPGCEPVIDLTLGEPRETMPPHIADEIASAQARFANYPPIRGIDELRRAIAAWLDRRFSLNPGIDPESNILPCNGSREGLFYAALPAVGRKKLAAGVRPAVLMCNPYYAAYIGAALATNAEPVYLDATRANGHLPDLEALASDIPLLERTCALYLCSPANPQGTVASPEYIARALELARQYDFMLFFDECYSELYSGSPPTGALTVAAATADRFRNIAVFNSLSKRSNLPGLRSGFIAGDETFLGALAAIRNLIGPQMPGPVQVASAAIWADEAHVEANRRAYQKKYDICDEVLGTRYGYVRPAGGFFLWLDLGNFGGGVDASVTLWKRKGVRVLPGAYLAQTGRDGTNPGADYVRVALVHPPETIRQALERIVAVFV
jgi:aspartate/methionine/tyrosine aminotransferase